MSTFPPASTPRTTSTLSGQPLPLVALPQDRLLTVAEGEVPWLQGVLGEGVRLKPLRLDMEANEWVVLAGFAPGSSVPLHYHTGEAEVYTLQGRWWYGEYPDQPQTAGSYLYEPGGSVHTLHVPEDNVEETVMHVRVKGANVNFDEAGAFHSILDATSLTYLVGLMAEGGTPNFIVGGRAQPAGGA